MPTSKANFLIAAVQAAPVFLDREATLDKACRLIEEASRNDAALVVFPESFIPAYPDWVWAVPAGEEAILNELYAQLLANAIEIPSPATRRLGQAAKRAKVHVAIGLTNATSKQAAAVYTIPCSTLTRRATFWVSIASWCRLAGSGWYGPRATAVRCRCMIPPLVNSAG